MQIEDKNNTETISNFDMREIWIEEKRLSLKFQFKLLFHAILLIIKFYSVSYFNYIQGYVNFMSGVGTLHFGIDFYNARQFVP